MPRPDDWPLARRRLLLAWAACALPLPRPPGAFARAFGAPPAVILAIQPLGSPLSSPRSLPRGSVTTAELDFVERALGAFFDFRLRRLPERPLPPATYYPARNRYRAEKILDDLGRQTTDRILGVTGSDISTTKPPHTDWGILGLGDIAGRACVISSFRCKRRAPSAAAATVRLGKIAVHEVGHTLGLQHCPNLGCLMEDAAGSVLTGDRDTDLCEGCRARLAARGFTVKRAPFRWALG